MRRRTSLIAFAATALLTVGCTSNGNGDCNCPPDAGTGNGTTGGTGGTLIPLASIGGPVLGAIDRHCWAPGPVDGGLTFQAQVVNHSSCFVLDGGPRFNEDAGPPESPYGATLWNTAGNDDDCKYFVSWHSTPIVKGLPVTFWVSVQYSTNGAPLTGLGISPDGGSGEIYFEVAGDPDGGISNHVSPTISQTIPIVEMPTGSGVYQIGPAVFFDEAGSWYVRYHFNENCDDILPDSPHGHSAYHIDVP